MREEFSLLDYQALAEFRYELRKFIHFSEQTAHRWYRAAATATPAGC